MNNNKIIAMMMTLSMLAAAFAGCLGGDDDKDVEDWSLMVASDVDADFVTSDWDPIIPNLNAATGMCDAILSAMTITDARDEVVDFTRAYYTSSQGVIGASGSAAITDVSELNMAGTTIAVQSGTTSDLYAADNLAAATIQAYADWPSVMAAVGDGTAHYAIGDTAVVALQGTILTTFSPENFGIAIRDEADNELEDALNVAITAIVASGEYDAHLEAYWPGTSGTLVDTTTAGTATAYPTPTEGSTLSNVLESGSLKFCSDTTYPPFESMDSNNNPVGFDVDIGHAIVDEIAEHYAGVADGTVLGCTNMDATNYDATATLDDATCIVEVDTLIRIGFLNPITGPISQFAPSFTYAWGAAVAELNAANDGYNFEVVEVDSGCDGTVAGTAAQALLDSNVVAVAGAACSGASIGANAVLSAAGIPMISYASTSPALSDATAYPEFFRVVPSDAIQGEAMKDMVASTGVTNPALIHMTNDYGAGLADSFESYWGTDNLCTKLGYEDTTTDFQQAVGQVMDAGCDSVVLASYSKDGATIIETMAAMGAGIPIFGADGIAGEAALGDYTDSRAANGVLATKPRAASGAGTFSDDCNADDVCKAGIFQSEAYDAVMMIGAAALHADGANMGEHIPMVGVDYAGASGVQNFLANGDVAGAGYDVCGFAHVPTYGDYFNCQMQWTATDGLTAAPFMGITVKIGFLNDATGPIAAYAGGFVAASQIALQIANTIGWNSNVQFEIVYADSGCDGTMGGTAAQSLIDAGVVGIVGAACSGATIGANAVASAAGIPMISYASTSPSLSDDVAYPDFFRVVPSDALQGQALNDVVAADMPADGTVALVHMTNDYGAGLADSFEDAYVADGGTLCTKLGYDQTTTDFTQVVGSIMSAECTSVVLVSYAADGGMIVDEMEAQGYGGQIYGGDGVAEEGLALGATSSVDGVIATKPAAAGMSVTGQTFAYLCGSNEACAGGIYTAEAFDAVVVMALASFASLSTPGVSLSLMIQATGQGIEGASGDISFMPNGEVSGTGYCVGLFSGDSAGAASFDCTRFWDPVNGLTDV
ncbi:MAG: ABC transporter substrate-binding protein [Candidatus Poseidoniales archaeon]